MNTEQLQQQIAVRDELVQELTRQLEQAAEQLDRLQRSGGMSVRPSAAAAASTSEMIKQQEAISEDLTYLVNQWETSQLPGAVGRIELQLEELRDLMTQAISAAASRPALPSQPAEPRSPAPASPVELHEADLLATLQEALNRDEDYIPEVLLEDDTPHRSSSSRHAAQDQPEDYHLPELPKPPGMVDFDDSDPGQLKDAIVERDQYIRTLLEEFRRLHKSASLQSPVDWQELSQVPEAMKKHLQKLERQLEEQLRIGEVSLSIERARLSRESTHLELARIQLQKQLKKQGIDPQSIHGLDPIVEERPPAGGDKHRTQKWLTMLRIKDN